MHGLIFETSICYRQDQPGNSFFKILESTFANCFSWNGRLRGATVAFISLSFFDQVNGQKNGGKKESRSNTASDALRREMQWLTPRNLRRLLTLVPWCDYKSSCNERPAFRSNVFRPNEWTENGGKKVDLTSSATRARLFCSKHQ